MRRFLEHLLPADEKVIHVKSWKPVWLNGHVEWPCMLIETKGGRRMTVWPVWDWVRVRSLFWTRKDDWVTLSVPLGNGRPTETD